MIVRTTLDPRAQKIAETAVATVFAEHAKRDKAAQAAVVILSKDGAVRVMVGGRDYARSEFNRAASARRQLGSAFKPFVFAAAFEVGVSPGSKVLDGPVTIRTASGAWSPRNYSRRYLGWIPLSVALARSSNVASVRLFQAAGKRRVIALARRAGFKDHIPAFPSLALGVIETNPLEVAGAYAAFNRGGLATPPLASSKSPIAAAMCCGDANRAKSEAGDAARPCGLDGVAAARRGGRGHGATRAAWRTAGGGQDRHDAEL